MEADISRYFKRSYGLGLVIHAPELFAGDHILNLCSEDRGYRQRSIEELQRVVEITRSLKPYFTTEKPCIVTNVGGFTMNAPLAASERNPLYNLLLDSLSKVDTAGVEILPQTMPPFPWHFGGQRYHNLFLDPEDMTQFCQKYGYRVCLDVSHSKLACNEHRWSFKEFVKQVAPFTAHLHIADAEGVDGEGLQIEQGNIDFSALADYLEWTPYASFIPEVWQGHKNEGEGFWVALGKLEKWL